MPMITGKMVVNAKYVASYTIDFKDSPKVVFTSNHAIRNFDASLRRRTWSWRSRTIIMRMIRRGA